jgi:hypothetical protein
MAQGLSLPIEPTAASGVTTSSRVAAVPWFVWSGALAVTSMAFGLYWDISWHETIGRDTFWTPAHLAIHFGGILAAFTCTYLVFSTTFSKEPSAQSSAVRVWGFRGPLGAFVTAWGGVTMVTSAPFDNWWHDSFGLDVQILSPPHVVLGTGMLAVAMGVLLLIVSEMNRASGPAKQTLTRVFFYLAGVQLFFHMILISESCDPAQMHSSIFYQMISFGVPLLLIALARASGFRWGATMVASIYMALMLAGLWLFPIFPASPKLGPVFTNVTHMVPMGFPVLLVFPALALDYVLNRAAGRNAWVQAFIAATVYLAVAMAAHWFWAEFMISPAARNAFFGQNYFPYAFPPSQYHFAWEFDKSDATRSASAIGLLIAWGEAFLSSRVGVAFGGALTRLRR